MRNNKRIKSTKKRNRLIMEKITRKLNSKKEIDYVLVAEEFCVDVMSVFRLVKSNNLEHTIPCHNMSLSLS